jgi:hypothetical protein
MRAVLKVRGINRVVYEELVGRHLTAFDHRMGQIERLKCFNLTND